MSNAALGSMFTQTAEQQEQQIRSLCLSEAVRTYNGTGTDADGIVAAAEKFFAFLHGTKAVPAKKKPRR